MSPLYKLRTFFLKIRLCNQSHNKYNVDLQKVFNTDI